MTARILFLVFLSLSINTCAIAQNCQSIAPTGLMRVGVGTICAGEEVELRVSGLRSGQSVEWVPDVHKTIGNDAAIVKPKASGSYFARVTSEEGCSWQFSIALGVMSIPEFTAGPDRVICPGDTALITFTYFFPYCYSLGFPGEYKYVTTNQYKVWPDRTSVYHFKGGKSWGCQGADTLTIHVANPRDLIVTAEVLPDQARTVQAVAELKNLPEGMPQPRYSWTFGDRAPADTGREVHHTFRTSGLYSGEVQADFGNRCALRAPLNLLDVVKFQLPNVITPDGDGRNDVFALEVSMYPTRLQVFNRQGGLVYEKAPYNSEWGLNAPAGQYYFRTTNTLGKEWDGWVEVVR